MFTSFVIVLLKSVGFLVLKHDELYFFNHYIVIKVISFFDNYCYTMLHCYTTNKTVS